MKSRMITSLKVGEEIIIENVVRLYRPLGRNRVVLCIESPIEIKIEKRVFADATNPNPGTDGTDRGTTEP